MVGVGGQLAQPCQYCGRLSHGFACTYTDNSGRVIAYGTWPGSTGNPPELQKKPPTEPPPWDEIPLVASQPWRPPVHVPRDSRSILRAMRPIHGDARG